MLLLGKKDILKIFLISSVIAHMIFQDGKSFAENNGTWIEHISEGFSSGSGRIGDPYIIKTAEDLALLAYRVNEGDSFCGMYFKLSADIDLRGKEWTPIGASDDVGIFSGNFDGNCKSIINMTIERESGRNGLFGTIKNGSVKNLTLHNVNVSRGYDSGGIAARIFETEITGCSVQGKIDGHHHTGGIIGYAHDPGEIRDCVVSCDITSIYLAGTRSENFFTIYEDLLQTEATGGEYSAEKLSACGGLIGYLSGEGIFRNCRVDVIINARSRFYIAFIKRSGGLVGGFSNSSMKVISTDVRVLKTLGR
jgi:hypothetical protein